MPVYYRETDFDQPPTFELRRTAMPQLQQHPSLLQPQFSAGSPLAGTAMASPSESTYLFGPNDPRGTQSESDGTESFGTWLSVSHSGTTPQMAKVPPSQSPFVAPQQRIPVTVGNSQQQNQPKSHLPYFPPEVRGLSGNETPRQAHEAGEVSRRSERWSREEFYPQAKNGPVPGAPFHKVTKEDYVIEQVVESTPKLVSTTRTVFPTQQQPQCGHPQAKQMPTRQQFQQPEAGQANQVQQQRQLQQWQAKQEQPQQQKDRPQHIGRPQGTHVQPQVPTKAQKMPQPVQEQPQQQEQQQQHQKQQQQYREQQQQQFREQPLQSSQQQRQQHVQPVQQMPKTQNFAQQHQYVQQQVQFQQPQQQLHEHPQYAVQREQWQKSVQQQQQQQQVQGVQIRQTNLVQTEQKQTQQKQQQQLQYVPQKEEKQADSRVGQQQQQQQEGQAVADEQQTKQNGRPKEQLRQQQQKQNQQFEQQEQAVQQRPTQQPTMGEQQQHFGREDESQARKQKQRTVQVGQMVGAEEDGEDEPPPQMQLAEAPEELIQSQKSGGERDGSVTPGRQTHRRHVMVNSPWYRQHPDFEHQNYQDFRNYAEPLYVCSDLPTDDSAGYAFDDSMQKSPDKYHYQHFQPQQRVHQYFSPSSVKWDSIYKDEFPDGQPPPFAHGPGSPYDYLSYHQKVNLDRRRAESEQRRRHHSPVPGAAEHGYKFGGMDFVDHGGFNPYSDVGEPFDERQSRRDLHTGPPRRRGDFYGLDYTTMLPDGQLRQSDEWAEEDARNYHGYQALPPRKNFRLCGRYTADPDAPLNITEAEGLDAMDSEYWVGNTLSNQHCVSDRELTDEEKRTFALLYGPGGFKPDHVTIRPDPVPDEPPVFSTTIGPQKSRSAADISPTPQDYVNPMKVEGESWMLGRRSEQSNYGLASSGEQPPFVRPARFPPHVPQWAKDRHFSMTRGAKSVDRSLFAPSWAKVPQPQPPYWVKRTDGGKEVGAVQQAKTENRERGEEKEEDEGEEREQRVEVVQQTQQQSQKQRQPTQQQQQQQMGQRMVQQQMQHKQVQGGQQQMQYQQVQGGQQQMQHKQVQGGQQQMQYQQVQGGQQQTQYQQVQGGQQQNLEQIHSQRNEQAKHPIAQQPMAQQQHTQVRSVQQHQHPQQIEKGMQKTTIITTVEIDEEHRMGNQPQQHQQQVGAVQRMDGQQMPKLQQQQQQQQKTQQQQQIETTKTTTNGATETTPMANGTPKVAQWKQQQRQPERQVQAVQKQIEQRPVQQQPFTQPGGMFYFREKGQTDGPKGQMGQVQTERRAVMKQQQVQSTEGASGLENLAVPKLEELPTFPSEGDDKGKGRQFTGEQQQMRKGNSTAPKQPKGVPNDAQTVQQQQHPQQQQPAEKHPTAPQWMPKFPMGRRWSNEPQEGDVFVDGHGRPVHYVREVGTDPRTGEEVTREEWRVVDEQRWEEEEGKEKGQKGNALPANQPRQFRQQTTIKTSQGFKQ